MAMDASTTKRRALFVWRVVLAFFSESIMRVCVCEYEMRLKEIPRRTVVVFVLIVHLLPSPEPRGQCTLAQVHLKPKMPSISIEASEPFLIYVWYTSMYVVGI